MKNRLKQIIKKGVISPDTGCEYMSKPSFVTTGPCIITCMKPGNEYKRCKNPQACRFYCEKSAKEEPGIRI